MAFNPQSSSGKPLWFKVTAASAALGATFSQPIPHIGAKEMTANVPSPPTNTAQCVDEKLLVAKLEAVEARTETKFEKLLSEIKLVGASVGILTAQVAEVKTDIAGVRTATAGVKWNIMATGLTIGGLIIAIAGFGASILQWTAALVGLYR